MLTSESVSGAEEKAKPDPEGHPSESEFLQHWEVLARVEFERSCCLVSRDIELGDATKSTRSCLMDEILRRLAS